MTKYTDMLLVFVALDTFTADDARDALELSPAGVNRILVEFERRGVLERVRVGHGYVYAVTTKGVHIVSKTPPIDPDERVLLCHVCEHASISIPRMWIASGDIICTSITCLDCDTEVYASWRQNWFSGWEGASPEEHVTVDLLGRA